MSTSTSRQSPFRPLASSGNLRRRVQRFQMQLLAQVSGDAVVHSLIYLIVLGLIFWLLWWLLSYIGLPEPFAKVARVILAVAAVLVCINVLLSITGHPLIRWSTIFAG